MSSQGSRRRVSENKIAQTSNMQTPQKNPEQVKGKHELLKREIHEVGIAVGKQKSREAADHRRLPSKNVDSSDGDFQSVDHSAQVAKLELYSRQPHTNQHLRTNAFNYQAGSQPSDGRTSQKTHSSLEQIIQNNQIEKTMKLGRSVKKLRSTASNMASPPTSFGTRNKSFQNFASPSSSSGLLQSRKHSERKLANTALQSLESATYSNDKYSYSNSKSSGLKVQLPERERISLSGSAAAMDEISPKKIKLSERIVQKANLHPTTYYKKTVQNNYSHIIKKSITIAPKPLAYRDSGRNGQSHDHETLSLAPQSSNLSSQRSLKPPHKPSTRTYYKSPRNALINSGIKSPSMLNKLSPNLPSPSIPPTASPQIRPVAQVTGLSQAVGAIAATGGLHINNSKSMN